MADAIKLETLTALLAAQSITVTNALGASVTLKLQDMIQTTEQPRLGLPDAINPQDCPIMAPRARDFVTNIKPQQDTFGADAAKKSIEYDLTYQLFFYPMGEGGSWTAYYGQNVTCVMQILLWFMTNTNVFSNQGAEIFYPRNLPALQAQMDATGMLYHGCELSFHVMHFLEA